MKFDVFTYQRDPVSGEEVSCHRGSFEDLDDAMLFKFALQIVEHYDAEDVAIGHRTEE